MAFADSVNYEISDEDYHHETPDGIHGHGILDGGILDGGTLGGILDGETLGEISHREILDETHPVETLDEISVGEMHRETCRDAAHDCCENRHLR